MARFRRRLSWLIVSWVLLQVGSTFASSVVLYASPMSGSEAICQCPGTTPGQQCPMHRHNGGGHESKPLDPGQCAMRGAQADFDVALLGWAVVGAVPIAVQVLSVPDVATPLSTREAPFVSRSELPDLPPPRR